MSVDSSLTTKTLYSEMTQSSCGLVAKEQSVVPIGSPWVWNIDQWCDITPQSTTQTPFWMDMNNPYQDLNRWDSLLNDPRDHEIHRVCVQVLRFNKHQFINTVLATMRGWIHHLETTLGENVVIPVELAMAILTNSKDVADDFKQWHLELLNQMHGDNAKSYQMLCNDFGLST